MTPDKGVLLHRVLTLLLDKRCCFGLSTLQAAIGRIQDLLILPTFFAANRASRLPSIAVENMSTWRAYASAFDTISFSATLPPRRNSISIGPFNRASSEAPHVARNPTMP